MNDDRSSRSPELDEVRRLLFPTLAPAEGWARIDAALARAEDQRRVDEELLDVIRRLHDEENAEDDL